MSHPALAQPEESIFSALADALVKFHEALVGEPGDRVRATEPGPIASLIVEVLSFLATGMEKLGELVDELEPAIRMLGANVALFETVIALAKSLGDAVVGFVEQLDSLAEGVGAGSIVSPAGMRDAFGVVEDVAAPLEIAGDLVDLALPPMEHLLALRESLETLLGAPADDQPDEPDAEPEDPGAPDADASAGSLVALIQHLRPGETPDPG